MLNNCPVEVKYKVDKILQEDLDDIKNVVGDTLDDTKCVDGIDKKIDDDENDVSIL